ncbi:MAG TPA: SRPBCC family protein, partial [Candidatus Elarobacter sp.]
GWHAHLEALSAVLANAGGADVGPRYEVLLPEYETLLARGSIDGATKTIRFTRSLPGPIHRVWSYLTEEDDLATWLTKRGAVPAEVGASFVLHMAGDDEMAEREGVEPKTYGTVRVFDAPHVLEYTWGVKMPDGELLESVVRFELESEGDRVALTLTHSGVIDGFESRTLGGWHSLLDALEARLDGRDPGSFMENFRRIEETYR